MVLVYDVGDRHSFHSLIKLLQQVSLVRLAFCPVLLIGNKCDNASGRRVESGEGKAVASKFRAHFCEVSTYLWRIVFSFIRKRTPDKRCCYCMYLLWNRGSIVVSRESVPCLICSRTQTSAAELGAVTAEAFQKLIQHVYNLHSSRLFMRQRKVSAPVSCETSLHRQETKLSPDPKLCPSVRHKKSLPEHFNFFASHRRTSSSFSKNH